MGKLLYKPASDLGKKILGKKIGNPETGFWSNSNFRAECPAKLVKFCRSSEIRVSTCNEASLSNYLTAHKHVAKILMKEMSLMNPILNDVNRYSGEYFFILFYFE